MTNPKSLIECKLPLELFLGYGIRQIIGASPQTKKKKTSK